MIFRFMQIFLFLSCVIAPLISSERKFRYEIMGEHRFGGKKFYPVLVFFAHKKNDSIRAFEYFSCPVWSARWDKKNDYLLYVTLTSGAVHSIRVGG